MSSFCAFIDFGEGRASFEPAGGSLESRETGLILAADARLDNRKELLDALDGDLSGRQTDAELILAAYRKWGEHCPEHLLGDFSFVVWDPLNRRLFGARDPLGVRSLYFMRNGSRFGIASTIRLLLEHPSTPHRVDLVAVGDFLSRITSEPDRTFFQDIRRLPAGHTLTATLQEIQIGRYWDVRDLSPLDLSEDEAASRFLELFRQAVKDRMASGAVGVAMSGGLDSTSVAAVASQELAKRGAGPLMTCSFVFDTLEECDERPYINPLSEALGIKTSFIHAERFWFLGDEEAYAPPLESPAMSWESPFRQMLQVFTDRGCRVLLTGHGADDLLLGSPFSYRDRLCRGDLRTISEIWRYSRSRRYGWRPFYRLLVEPLLSSSTALSLRNRFSQRGLIQAPVWITPDFARRTGLAERLIKEEVGPAKRTAFDQMYQRLITQPSYCRSIDWYDRNARPFGLEVRHPFLDKRLFEYTFSISPDHMFRLGERKPILRKALTGILPDSVRLRLDKTSLGGFVDFSLKKEADHVRKLFSAPLSEKLGIVNGEATRRAFEHYCTGVSGSAKRSLWNVVTLELWLRRHLHTFDVTSFEAQASKQRAA